MKKYIPYLLIALIIFFMGRFSAPDHSKEVVEKLQTERKLILEQLNKKQVEIYHLNERGLKQDKKIDTLEVKIQQADQKAKAIEARYKKKLAEVARYTLVQRDSFFYVKYPGQDTIRNVDSKKVIADLVHGEGQESLNTALKEQIAGLNAVVAEQNERLKTEQSKFERQKESTVLMENFAQSNREEADYYRGKYKKQRSQKGLLTAGMVVLIGLIIVK